MSDSIAQLSPFSPKSLAYEYKDYLKKYIKFSGKATRRQFWSIFIINFILSFIFGLIPHGFATFRLLTLLPEIGLYIRRFHDMGLSSKQFILSIIPLGLGAILSYYQAEIISFTIIYMLILFVMAASATSQDPTQDDNRYKMLYISTSIIVAIISANFLLGNSIKKSFITLKATMQIQHYSYIIDKTLLDPIFKLYPDNNFPKDIKKQILEKDVLDKAMKSLIENQEIELYPEGKNIQIIFNNINSHLCELTISYQGRYRMLKGLGNNKKFTKGILNGADFGTGCTCSSPTCSAAITISSK